ncbi:tol-pal system protein YbgF [Shewanella cyperi]|uniref:Cell division coordinator CpoB n=1 Tax=Shewanella cyperi TaxID=2814292 RepID=A0A974XW87_9GAMM|nr:tol-pal system protein YbgF [Shewanella cyperi]QSX31434.1 tol-pal system protein YbgF [Shewanella cyperi]QSX42222.1 tol-pal system protein YbgF [Shewanella cyperi]
MNKSVLAMALLLAGTAVQAAPAPVEDLGGGSLDERIARLERVVKAKQQTELDLLRRVDTLQQEVLDLRGLTEQQNYQINQMLQRQRQLYDEIANLSAQPAQASSSVAATPEASAPDASLDETALYERAVNLVLKERQYDEATDAFRGFIKQYPDSTYAANANYWLGQLLYNKNQLDEAKQAFTAVVNRFTDSGKRGDSMVKLGLIAEKSGDKAGAKNWYQKVLKEYANSAAARIAQQQLSALKG